MVQAQALHAHGQHDEAQQCAVRPVQGDQVQQGKITAKLRIAANAFVVVDQVTTAVKNRLAPVDFDADGVMRGMAVDEVHAGLVNERAGKAGVGRRDRVAPVPAPVDGDHHQVARSLVCLHAVGDAAHRGVRQVRQQIYPRAVRRGCPGSRYAAAVDAAGEDQHAPPIGQWQCGGCLRRRLVGTGARHPQPGPRQAVQCLVESGVAPVQDMVVGQYAAVDIRGRETGDVVRMHAVLDTLAGPGCAAGGDCGFEVDDTYVRRGLFECGQGVTPDIGEVHRPGNRPVGPFGQAYIVQRRLAIGFVNARIAGVGQGLVNGSAGHDVASHEERGRAGRVLVSLDRLGHCSGAMTQARDRQ